jgi:hypothetical protein
MAEHTPTARARGTGAASHATERSDAGLTVAWCTQDRRRRQVVAGATRTQRSLQLNGQPQTFTVLAAGRRWAAVRHEGGETITIAGNEIDPGAVSLRPVGNPADELLADPRN